MAARKPARKSRQSARRPARAKTATRPGTAPAALASPAALGIRRLREQMQADTTPGRTRERTAIIGALARLEDAYEAFAAPPFPAVPSVPERGMSRLRRSSGALTAVPPFPTRQEVVYVPSPPGIVEAMLDLADIREVDVVCDLGCGDGRIVIAAAQRGARAIGLDKDPARIDEAAANAARAGVIDRVTFIVGDFYDTQVQDATVVTLYLLPSVNAELQQTVLSRLRPGTRIVSHAFAMDDWEPAKTAEFDGRQMFLWVVPDSGSGTGPV
jgi:2-polyprenyl-3-methyl-5-hydroxy-6-metoxy-1,4-benzoquinol methylase